MILRRLYDILKAGLQTFAANPSLYDTLLGDFLGMEAKEVAGIKGALARSPVRLQHGYPQNDIQMPCMALLLQAESQAQKFLGDIAILPLGSQGAGSNFDLSAQLLIYSENIDLTAALYEIARAILICSHKELARQGLMSPTFTGMDLAPDPSKLPENVFARIVGIRGQYTYALPELLEQDLVVRLAEGLYLPPGTDRTNEPYDSGVSVDAQPKP